MGDTVANNAYALSQDIDSLSAYIWQTLRRGLSESSRHDWTAYLLLRIISILTRSDIN